MGTTRKGAWGWKVMADELGAAFVSNYAAGGMSKRFKPRDSRNMALALPLNDVDLSVQASCLRLAVSCLC